MGFIVTFLVFASLFVIAELIRPKPELENARPKGLGEFQLPTATEDRKVPVLWGTVRQKGPNVTWFGDLLQVAITEKVRTSLFTSERVVKAFEYFVGIKFDVCRGPDVELIQIWSAEDSIFLGSVTGEGSDSIDLPNLFGGNDIGQGGIVGTFSWRPGNTTQSVNTYLDGTTELQIGGQTPRFTGNAYLAWEQGKIGNTTTIKPWSFEVRRIPNGLGLTTASVNGGADANLLNVAYEIMTGDEWGFNFPAGDFNLTNWKDAAETLRTEGNGFSMLLDTPKSGQEILDEIQRQGDLVIYLDHRTGLWDVKLARKDYTIASLDLLSSPIDVEEYNAGSWEETINYLTVSYQNRANDYNSQPAPAHDPANAQLQGGGTVRSARVITATQSFPGVKDATLANAIAWRELDTVCVPLINARIKLDRSWWDLTPGAVFKWTNTQRDLVERVFRVKTIDYGTLQDGEIIVEVVEDIFQFRAGSFAAPPATKWVRPNTSVSAPATQIAFEAPRAFLVREETGAIGFFGAVQNLVITGAKFWCSMRRPTGAVFFGIRHRASSGTPSGSYEDSGASYGFMLAGKLKTALNEGDTNPKSSLIIAADPDSQTQLINAFETNTDPLDVGLNLINLCMIGDPITDEAEFFLCYSAQTSGADVQLNTVWRGVMCCQQRTWPADTPVYVLHNGGNLPLRQINEIHNVDVQLEPRNSYNVAVGLTDIELRRTGTPPQFDRRARKPYPPGSISMDGTTWGGSASLEASGSGAENYAMDIDWTRRDYRTTDEIEALNTDAASLFSDFPSANSTVHNLELIDDPDVTPVVVATDTGNTGTSWAPLRIDILKASGGSLPTTMRVDIEAEHTDNGDVLQSRHELQHTVAVTSALTGQEEFGALDTNDESAEYTADANGTHTFVLSSAFSAGDVEYAIDTGSGFGSWTQLIQATTTGTPGTVVANIGDKIKIRHLSGDSSVTKQIDMTAPGAGTDAFGILFT